MRLRNKILVYFVVSLTKSMASNEKTIKIFRLTSEIGTQFYIDTSVFSLHKMKWLFITCVSIGGLSKLMYEVVECQAWRVSAFDSNTTKQQHQLFVCVRAFVRVCMLCMYFVLFCEHKKHSPQITCIVQPLAFDRWILTYKTYRMFELLFWYSFAIN